MGTTVIASACEFIYDLEDATAPEYLLRRANQVIQEGSVTVWIEDTISGETHSYADFESETRSVASFLWKQGMRKGDTLLYMTYDLVKIHLIFTGVWRANGVIRASYPEDDEETILDRVKASRVGWILCDPPAAAMCKAIAEAVQWDVHVIVYGEEEGCSSVNDLFLDDGQECPELDISGESPALILCTSGTTGRSKGAVHSHHGLLQTFASTPYYLPFKKDAPNLFISKGTHITGAVFPLCAFVTGCHSLVMPIISKQNLFEAVHNHKPGFIWGFPTFLMLMVNDAEAANYDFSSVVIAASGGAQFTPQMEKTLQKLPNLESFVNVFGLTEVCPVCSDVDPTTQPLKKMQDVPPLSVGKVSPGALLTIRDPETGAILGSGERGEICIKSDRAFHCYLNNPEATEQAFIDGYFKTGDLGYCDENHFVFLVDRIKEIFKYFNNHISPTELEEVIGEHEGVSEVCVFGVEDPDGGGSIPRAVVTLKANVNASSQDILETANARLPDYKKLRGGLFIVDELPKGKTGKITRNLVAQLQLPNPG